MTITIVIPCHDAERYVAQAIGSALEGSRPPDEIVVVDDASSDGSLEVALRFAAAEPARVRVLRAAYRNGSCTRNLGALAARGDAIMFLDADDVLGPHALAALEAGLAGRGDAVAACPWSRLELNAGRWIEQPPSCAPRLRGQDALSAWLTGWYYPPCAVLWSRAAFERAGRWDELAVANQDGDLMMRALASGVPLIETSAGRAYYRRRPPAESPVSARRLTAEGLSSRIRTLQKIASRLQQDGQINRYRGPLAAAFARVAEDAGERHPPVVRQAHALAREYAPSPWTRLWQVVLPRRPEPAGAERQGVEVLCGLDRAARVLASGAAAATSAMLSEPPSRPHVTAILPTYNRAHLLPRAIGSALAQSFTDFELLVVDDGSTDRTEDVVRGYADRRIRYLRQPTNAGVSAARNRGLREARADLIAFLDSDDEWLPERLAKQVARFSELPDRVGLLYAGVEDENTAGQRRERPATHRGNLYRELLLTNLVHGTSGVMLRRSVVAAVGFFDEGIPAIEDYDYWVRIARFFEIDCIEEPLSRYHDPSGGERKSLDVPANIEARWWFYRKHRVEMRGAGVAHLFLRESLRRTLLGARPDRRAARRLALQAVLEAPVSRMTVAALMQTLLPAAGRMRWVRHHAALQ